MSSSQSLFQAPAQCVELLGVGAVFGAVGFAFALDFRGVTTWHVRQTLRVMNGIEGPLGKLRPRAQGFRAESDQRQRWQLQLERGIGAAFVLAGMAIAAVGVVGLAGWALR